MDRMRLIMADGSRRLYCDENHFSQKCNCLSHKYNDIDVLVNSVGLIREEMGVGFQSGTGMGINLEITGNEDRNCLMAAEGMGVLVVFLLTSDSINDSRVFAVVS